MTPTSRIPRSFFPNGDSSRNGQALVKAAAAFLFHCRDNSVTVGEAARRLWPNDIRGAKAISDIVNRSATVPATTTGSGWADSLAATAVADFISTMGGGSAAGSTVLKRGHSFQFDGAAAILVPGMVNSANDAVFVQEAFPIPVVQLSTSGVTLAPRAFKTIVTFTSELFAHSTPNIVALVSTVLTESVGLSLDAALFSNNAGSASAPPGLLNGISPLTASSATVKQDAMKEDIAAIGGAVSAVAGNGPIIFIASPKQALALRLWAGSQFNYEILASSALVAGVVIACAPNGLASAIDPAPRFDSAREATLHMDTVPSQIVGSPNLVAAPQRSLFQTDSVGLKLGLEVSWGLRSSAAIAWTQSVVW
jgi:hypothetical protein